MKKPIKSVEEGIKGHPVVWGALVFLLGSGAELLMTQRMLGVVALETLLKKLGLASLHPIPGFILQEIALFLGLVFFAAAVHLIARTCFSKQGRYLSLLTTFLFVSGLVSIVATFLGKLAAAGSIGPGVLYVIPVLSLLVYVLAIRECYHIPFVNALIAGAIPFAAAVVFFLV